MSEQAQAPAQPGGPGGHFVIVKVVDTICKSVWNFAESLLLHFCYVLKVGFWELV